MTGIQRRPAYATGPAIGDSHTLTAERFGAFERVAVQALKGKDYSLHLGFGADQLIQAPNSGAGTPNALTLSGASVLQIEGTNSAQSNLVTGPITLTQYERFGHLRDTLAKEGFQIGLPTGN